MSNIVNLFGGKAPEKDSNVEPKAVEFIEMFYDWALANGLDVESDDFAYDSAVIMTMVQGMIYKART